MIDRRIAFLGAGNMANAIIRGLLRAGLAKEKISATVRRDEKKQELETTHGITVGFDNLAAAQGLLGRFDAAEETYRATIGRNPFHMRARAGLAETQQEAGRLDDALATFREALAIRPKDAELLHGMGVALIEKGRLDEAAQHLRRALESAPAQAKSWLALSQVKRQKEADDELAAMEAQHGKAPADSVARMQLSFGLGKAHDDLKDYGRAFDFFAEGNAIRRKGISYDGEKTRAEFAAMKAAFSKEFFERHKPSAVEDDTPVFVVGMPRSGTSLIEQVLATLPGVHGAGELTDLPDVLQAAAADHPAGDYRFPETPAGYDDDRLRRLGRRYLERLRVHAPAATHIVDKLPANFAHLGLLHRMLPQARIVHAMRDPMDACFSCFSRLFAADNLAFTYELGALGRYWVTYHRLMRHWHAVLPLGRILDLPYEAMVTDFEAQARRLVAHLGLPWDERCLGFHRNRRVVGTASAAQVRRPIYRSSVARWKAFERHLGPLMDIVGPYR